MGPPNPTQIPSETTVFVPRGVYITDDIEKARKHGDTVLELKANLGKVKKIDSQGHSMQKTWKNNGYDSAWVPANCGMTNNGHSETCVYDPQRIKLVEDDVSSNQKLIQNLDELTQLIINHFQQKREQFFF